MAKFNIRLILLLSIFAVLSAYLAYQARGYLFGPQIFIESPKPAEIVHNSYFMVSGRIFNAANIFLNGRQIYTDEQGNFNEGLLLARGYNIIEITAQDKFGRIRKEKRDVVLSLD